MESRKNSPRKNDPGKLRNKKSWGERRASWCVWNVGMWSIYENPKVDNKPKTRKQRIVGWASNIVVYVWNVGMWSFYKNPKLDNKTSGTPLVFYGLVHVGSGSERQTSLYVYNGINR